MERNVEHGVGHDVASDVGRRMSRGCRGGTIGDARRTPRMLFEEIERRYANGRFTVDVAADPYNHLANLWCADPALGTGQPDGLDPESWVGAVWCNPPWSNILPWVHSARIAASYPDKIQVAVLLLPTRTGTEWWPMATASCEHWVPIRGRVHFESLGGTNSSNPEDVGVFVFRPPLVAARFR